MPAKKKGKRSTGARKSAPRKSAGAKKRTRRRSATSSAIGKTAAKVLAGAAAGAVRAIIPQLEEAAGASERVAETGTRGERKPSKSSP